MAERTLDALVVTSLSNVFYLTNFTGSAGILVLTPDKVWFISDFRYATAVSNLAESGHACPGLELFPMNGSYETTLTKLLSAGGRIGFEAAHVTVDRHAWLVAALAKSAPAATLVSTVGLVEALRVRKDEYEIATLRDAARRLSGVAARIMADLRRGRTEREVAMTIDLRIREAGFSAPAFETIVASGANAALPHATPGERILGEGDLVVLDFGGVYDSYCVDLTRTVSIGVASGRAREVYGAVRDAHDRAIAAVAPGRSPFEIDQAARDALTEKGLGEAFGHGTGHGLGIEVHEEPRIARRRPELDTRDETLLAGMVFTIEPGAYLPGWGGVRIEDDVLVTDIGVEVLTDVTTELIEI
jgi:Xaa-Pro aminopeptidase